MSDDLREWVQRLTELTGIDYGRYLRMPDPDDDHVPAGRAGPSHKTVTDGYMPGTRLVTLHDNLTSDS